MADSGCAKPKEPPNLFTVAGEDGPRLSQQNQTILDRLREGPAMNFELMRLSGAMNPSARISEVRQYLQSIGEDLKATPEGKGVWRYRIWRYRII